MGVTLVIDFHETNESALVHFLWKSLVALPGYFKLLDIKRVKILTLFWITTMEIYLVTKQIQGIILHVYVQIQQLNQLECT